MQKRVLMLLLGCLALIQGANVAYPCNVDNCQQCSYYNFCGLCNDNYLLTINTQTNAPFCELIQCTVDNCQSCLSTNYCHKCANGFYVGDKGECVSGNRTCSATYCSYCTEEDVCQICQFGYNIQVFENTADNYCASNVPLQNWCAIGFYKDMCRVCKSGYLVNVDYSCVEAPTFTCSGRSDGCTQCSSENTCSACLKGYKLVNGDCEQLACNISYCTECSDSSTCSSCMSLYELRNNLCVRKTYGCNMEFCQSCGEMAQVCTQCDPGYQIQSIKDANSNIVAARCVKITEASGTNSQYVKYCSMLKYFISGLDTQLSVGCGTCMTNYLDVGGFCVGNLSQKNYVCNVTNCEYCIQDNYCGKCMTGYHTQKYSGGMCFKDYSPLFNCQLSISSSLCYMCNTGYVSNMGTCLKFNPDVECKIEGCMYCLQDNECQMCRSGFDGNTNSTNSTNSTCTPLCSQSNCFQCQDSSKCQICTYGYVLTTDGDCILATDATTDCKEFDASCTECNAQSCTVCATGKVLNTATNTCCDRPVQDYMGCSEYESVCSTTCTKCQLGYVLEDNNCFKLPCSLDNCIYCFRSDVCVVCSDGFTLKDGSCTPYTKISSCPTNCITCNSNGQCSQCINGYQVYQGVCICEFQNCLTCIGNAFCTLCAYPAAATTLSVPGCSPNIVKETKCQVNNCMECKTPNMCSECTLGYVLLANGTCSQLSCASDSNCVLCDQAQNFCYLCKVGFIPNEFLGNSCVSVPSNYACQVQGCAVCQTSTTCGTCLQTFQLTSDKSCQKITCLDNCFLCLQSSTCFVCNHEYYLNTDNKCVQASSSTLNCTSIQGCLECENFVNSQGQVDGLKCQKCAFGLQPSADTKTCVPQDCNTPNCQICMATTPQNQHTMCTLCEQGYHLNSYLQCVAYSPQITTFTCDVYNCLFCDINNECALCAFGWSATGTLCETTLYCSTTNCARCTTADNCTTCDESYSLNLGGCVPQCNITNCAECSTLELCGVCDDTFALSSDQKVCDCPDSTFSKQENKCVCPTGKLLFNNTCVDCDVENCKFCQSANQCGECLDTFTLSNNVCSCPDSTFTVQNNACVCPTGDKEFNSTCVECGVEFCASCNTPNNCLTCDNTFQLGNNNTCECPTDFTLSNNACYQCNNVDFCQTCNNTNFCSVCQDSFVVSNGTCVCPTSTTLSQGVCVQCNIKNCDLCETANVCTSCATGSLKLNEVCISCNIANCQSCSSNNVCSSCANNLAVNSQGNQCVSCSLTNCAQCSSDNVCSTCNSGFSFNRAGSCVDCSNVNGCEICSSDGVCATCLPGFNLNSGQCTVCASPCKTCNSDGSCATCQLPFSTTPNSNGQCFTCSVANCVSCSSSNKNICETCASTYVVNANTGACELVCSTNLCLQCDDVAVCELCIDGYTTSGSGCKLCDQAPVCKACQPTATDVCTSCSDGYYLDGGVCKACAESNCAKCPTSPSICQEYKADTGQFTFETTQGIVVPAVCNAGCLTCSQTNPDKCINCNRGYSLQDGSCIPCTSPCKTCKDGQPSKCLSCYSNAYLSGEACFICTASSNCLTCSSSNLAQCTSCPYGYSLNSNNVCVLGCPDNCLSCTSSSTCNVCIEGYSVNNNGNCLPCLSNCRQCSGTEQGVCLSCGKGFFLNTEGTCSVCTEFCSSCNANGCTECVAGYALTNDFQCAKKCKTPCASCSTTDPSSCFSCLAGYSFDQTTSSCLPVTSCTDNLCNVCPFGFTLNINTCFQCNSNCARCSLSDKDTCTSCYDGSYLRTSDSTCVSCPTGCDTCTTAANCLTCSSGYTAQSSPVDSVVNCVQCESPCQQCIGNSQTCTSCDSGFKLEGWKCVSTFNFGMILVLNTNLSNFYSNYLSFLQAIAQALGQTNINVVTVIILASGSVNFTGNGTTTQQTDSNGALTQYNNINTALASGNTVAGMELTSSQVDVNGGTVPQDSSGVNLPLILGITIPLGLLLLGGIIYFCCRRSNLPPSGDRSKEETDMTVRQQFELSNDITGRAI